MSLPVALRIPLSLVTTMIEKFKIFFKFAFERRALLQNIYVGLFVGTILNLINQGHALMHLDFAHLDAGKFFLTFCVPYLVSTYSGSLAKMKYPSGGVATLAATLQCANCRKHEIHVNKGEILPQCPVCGEKTEWRILRLDSGQ